MRGCDWRRILVRSETVKSASASSASTRRRVPSPAARSAPCRESKLSGAERIVGPVPTTSHKHIRISLCQPHGRRKPGLGGAHINRQCLWAAVLQFGARVGAVQDHHAASPAAESPYQFSKIVRTRSYIL